VTVSKTIETLSLCLLMQKLAPGYQKVQILDIGDYPMTKTQAETVTSVRQGAHRCSGDGAWRSCVGGRSRGGNTGEPAVSLAPATARRSAGCIVNIKGSNRCCADNRVADVAGSDRSGVYNWSAVADSRSRGCPDCVGGHAVSDRLWETVTIFRGFKHRPLPTGSICTAKTMGMTDAARLTVGTALPTVIITSPGSRESAAADLEEQWNSCAQNFPLLAADGGRSSLIQEGRYLLGGRGSRGAWTVPLLVSEQRPA
jgi:hypothetical protein